MSNRACMGVRVCVVVAIAGAGNVYIAARDSLNASQIPPTGEITETIGILTFKGGFPSLEAVALDSIGSVCMAGGRAPPQGPRRRQAPSRSGGQRLTARLP